jgi:glycosyltransferase involved in cell wall biosynthesis
MKIILFQLTGLGGTQLYLSQLAKGLSKNNDVVMLIGSHLYNEKHYENCNAKIILFNTTQSYSKMFLKLINPITYNSILKKINNESPDVIHLVFEDLISGIIFCLLRFEGKRLIFTEHDPSFHTGEAFLVRLNQYFAKLLTRYAADAIIVHGDKQKKILHEKGIRSQKVHSMPHGDYSYYTKWSDVVSEEENTILFFGQIQEYKGLKYLIEAAPKVASAIPNAKFIIAGGGDITKHTDSLKDKTLFEIHNRFIPDEEVAYFFQRASIVVLPYIDASQSGIVPVAYAFKKSVVVTNVGSLAELVEDNVTGFVVPPRNTDELSKAIIRLLKDDNQREKFGLAAYNKMRSELSWDKIADKTVQIYQDS